MTHLFFDIRKLHKLDEKRSPMFEKNRFAKVMVYLGIAFWAAYLVLFGVLLPSAFSEGFPGMEPYHILNKGLLIVLAIIFAGQVIIVEFGGKVFRTCHLNFSVWLQIFLATSLIFLIPEIVKAISRQIKRSMSRK